MSQEKDRYSLWITPKGGAGTAIQTLINKLADENNAPHFVPHITLVANIFADSTEIHDITERIRQCAAQIEPFVVKFAGYGYMEEEFRCLYLLAAGEGLQSAYMALATQFPQIRDQHFQAMPHMSVLYGNYLQATKDRIIDANPLIQTEFVVDSFDLYLTHNPIESWRLAHSFPLA